MEMNLDDALSVVYSCYCSVSDGQIGADDDQVGCYSYPLAEKIKDMTGIEPICTESSTLSDVALSLMDSAA